MPIQYGQRYSVNKVTTLVIFKFTVKSMMTVYLTNMPTITITQSTNGYLNNNIIIIKNS